MSAAAADEDARLFGRFKPYPAYKDSGVEWLGEIPAHWGVLALKRLGAMRAGIAITSEDIEPLGEYPVFGGNGIRGYAESYTHDGEFPLVGRQGALCGCVNFASGKFWASEHAVVVTPTAHVDPHWMTDLLSAMSLNQYSQSAAQPGISVETIGAILAPVPPQAEQRSIAAFLDRETARIDALMAKKERLIDLLQEQRTARITRAVTKGLDPNVPMKDSGVEWLAEIPAHWELKKTTWLFSIGSGTTPKSEELGYYGGDTPWVTTSELRESVVRKTEKSLTQAALREYSSLKLHPAGSVAVAMYGATIGRLGILGIDAAVNQACCVFSNPIGMAMKFWFYSLQMRRPYLLSLGYGGGQANLSQELLRSVRVPTPPLPEQRRIAAFLDHETTRIDSLISKVREAIECLKELRTALISAAVAGKIDVREETAA